MHDKKETKIASLGFSEALTILFVALKLCGVIDWPWLWVVSPIWITLLFVAFIAVVIVVLGSIGRRL